MPNVNTLQDEHVVLKYEFVDRIFVNGYVARFQGAADLSLVPVPAVGEPVLPDQDVSFRQG